MKVFKFGGASVKDVSGVKNVAIILQSYINTRVVVVISTMGKTTNALEKILNQFRDHSDHTAELNILKQFHASIMAGLFTKDHVVFKIVDGPFKDLEIQLKIHECHIEQLPPPIVFKDNQRLVSCKVTDYTFITENHMRQIFSILAELNIQINVMQNSAISFSFCIDFLDGNKLRTISPRILSAEKQ